MPPNPNRETELSDPVSRWLISLGFTPYAEVLLPKYGRQIDLIGKKGKELITVELKRSLTKHAIHQTATCDLITPHRYAAVGKHPQPQGMARCRRLGIGEFVSDNELGAQGVAELQSILDYVDAIGLSDRLKIDPSLARGLSYYTGAIIEIATQSLSTHPHLVRPSRDLTQPRSPTNMVRKPLATAVFCL